MKKYLLIVITCALLLSGCYQFVSIDWVDFVMFNDVKYMADHYDGGQGLSDADLDGAYATVRFKLSGNVKNPNYRSKNGDAAFLEPGTKVYKLKNYKPEFRLAVKDGEKLKIYEAYHNTRAKTGGELLDIDGKVSWIGINSDEDGITEFGSIKDDLEVLDLVNMVMQADIYNEYQGGNGRRYFLVFYMKDGTSVRRAYYMDSNYLSPGMILPEEFQSKIAKVLKTNERSSGQ